MKDDDAAGASVPGVYTPRHLLPVFCERGDGLERVRAFARAWALYRELRDSARGGADLRAWELAALNAILCPVRPPKDR
jgi:hypothetical protein